MLRNTTIPKSILLTGLLTPLLSVSCLAPVFAESASPAASPAVSPAAKSTAVSSASANAWNIDPAHTNAHFSIKHMMVSNVTGDFGKVTGIVHYDGKNLDRASVEATIDMNSLDTRDQMRDKHLKTAEFFDVEKYPTMNFKSQKIVTLPDNKFKLIGDLTLHGVTREVTLLSDGVTQTIKDPHGKTRFGTSATATINRQDFGLNYSKTLDNGGLMIGNDVGIVLDLELIQ